MITGPGGGVGHHKRVFTKQGAGVGDRVATCLSVIPKNRTKLIASGIDLIALMAYNDVAGEKKTSKIYKDAKTLAKKLQRDLPSSKVVFISPKPSVTIAR